MKNISGYEINKVISHTRFLAKKMAYDREQHLTHAQRNMNDDWNIGYLNYIAEKLEEMMPVSDESDVDELPF